MFTGAVYNLENYIKEPTTGQSFAFSKPYFYGYSPEEDNLCLATIWNSDWPNYVFWSMNALIYAEENGVAQMDFFHMPTNPMFGEDLEKMFQYVVLAGGNYGELYERNVEPIIPRSGRNLLSRLGDPGPLHYPMPFPK